MHGACKQPLQLLAVVELHIRITHVVDVVLGVYLMPDDVVDL